jgi:hypothetical protein
MLTLDNPRTRLAGAIAIDVVPARPGEAYDPIHRAPLAADGSGTIHRAYQRAGDEWVPPDGVFIRLRNLTRRQLYCVLLDMTDQFRMTPQLFEGDWIAPETAYVRGGERIDFHLPPSQKPVPGAKVIDWLKVLVAETPIDSPQFVLPHLGQPLPIKEVTRRSAAKHGTGVQSVIDRLGFTAMERGTERHAKNDDLADHRDAIIPVRVAGDWTTAVVKIVTSVPDEEKPE